jgi:hypothetical protein
MIRFFARHKAHWVNKSFIVAVGLGLLFLAISLYINWVAGNYAVEHQSNFVNDIILNQIPVVNVDFVVVEGGLLVILFTVLLLILEPKRIPFILKSTALFTLIRAVFITLTHVGPFPSQSVLVGNKFLVAIGVAQQGGLFFSGHAGLPFLATLIFWENKMLRYTFLFISVFFGISVLLGHLHYSIDVFAAFFITYSIFRLSLWLFPKDYQLLREGL